MVSEVTDVVSCESVTLFDGRNNVDTLRNSAEKHIEEGEFAQAVNDILALEELYDRSFYPHFEIDRAIMGLFTSLFYESYTHAEQLVSKLNNQFELKLSPLYCYIRNSEKNLLHTGLNCVIIDQLGYDEALTYINEINDPKFRSYAYSALAHYHPTQAEFLLQLAHTETQAMKEVIDRLDANLEIATGYAYFEMSDKEASVLEEIFADIALLEGEFAKLYMSRVGLYEAGKYGFFNQREEFLEKLQEVEKLSQTMHDEYHREEIEFLSEILREEFKPLIDGGVILTPGQKA